MRKRKKSTAKKRVSREKKVKEEVIPFKTFFAEMVNKGILKEYQAAEIEEFFKDMKLRSKEPKEKFLKTLDMY